MRFLNCALLLAALSLGFISCENDNDNIIDPPLESPFIMGASFTSADYILTTTHKSYYNPFFIEEVIEYKNYAYGLQLHVKLNDPKYLNIIEHLKLYAPDGTNALYYEFDKYKLHEMFSDTLGGYILTIDSLYYIKDLPENNNFYPAKKFNWTIWVYDVDGNFAPAFTTETMTDSYIYHDSVSAEWQDSLNLKINFSAASPYVSSREVKMFLFDSQKKYVKDYPPANINKTEPSVTLSDVPANAAFYRAEISDVYNGIKRTYTGRFESLPARL